MIEIERWDSRYLENTRCRLQGLIMGSCIGCCILLVSLCISLFNPLQGINPHYKGYYNYHGYHKGIVLSEKSIYIDVSGHNINCNSEGFTGEEVMVRYEIIDEVTICHGMELVR